MISKIKQLFSLFGSAMSIPKDIAHYQLHKRKWRHLNRHNYTVVGNRRNEQTFPIENVKVGNYTYGSLRVLPFGHNDCNLSIGSFCSIAGDVLFLLGGEHSYKTISTFPFKTYFANEGDSFSKGDIILEDDVWIGHSSLILSGVTLARGTVVAAGSVVTKSTEPYSVIGGNPAKLIKKRFPDNVISILSDIDYSRLSNDKILTLMEKLTDDKVTEYSSDQLKDLVAKINAITPVQH